jgi:hypothetical protein
MSWEVCAYCNDCKCWHDQDTCRMLKAEEKAEKEAQKEYVQRKRFKDQYKLETTKRKTKCYGCDESIIKDSLRVHHFGELTEFKDRVYRLGYYFHLSCWNRCSGMKPSDHENNNRSKEYENFYSYPEDIRTIILNSNEDTDKFIPVIPEKTAKTKKKSSTNVSTSSSFVAVITHRKPPPPISGGTKRQRKATNHQQPSSPPKAKRSKCSDPNLVSP